MRFKPGDKVIVREWEDMAKEFGTNKDGNILTPVIFTCSMKSFCGKTLTIKDYFPDTPRYTAEETCRFSFPEESLTLYEFSKSDLKDGMLCQMRDGEKMLWLYGEMRGITSSVSRIYNNLKSISSCRDIDIVKVGYPSRNADTLEEMLQMDFGKVIWVRKEESIVKEFSMDEINKILKEKFPDVDKFKINTTI